MKQEDQAQTRRIARELLAYQTANVPELSSQRVTGRIEVDKRTPKSPQGLVGRVDFVSLVILDMVY